MAQMSRGNSSETTPTERTDEQTDKTLSQKAPSRTIVSRFLSVTGRADCQLCCRGVIRNESEVEEAKK